MPSLSLVSLDGFPMVKPGDDLARLTLDAMAAQDLAFRPGDVLVLAQKIVSKSEGRLRDLASIDPSDEAIALAKETDKDPRLVQAILDESTDVVRKRKGVLIVRHKRGWVMAQAGIDQSNVEGGEDGQLLLLPLDPDRSARLLRQEIERQTGTAPAVVIADSFGRPFRNGTTGVAIGAAGLTSYMDIRGERDLFGRELKVSTIGHADEIASAASLLMGQAAEGRPAVLLRGLPATGDSPASDLVRPIEEDLFR
ncbi:coenzyme F420-0:L-glutamate ligase [Roseibium sp.]|uniref:coenzyme F420-0:L-glutamate ligase n=1 Tax=Roseibium sp. TaxID=1936156 RepID=UPI003A96ADCD